ncbi:MAG: PDZ domain-containing protein, partial [Planctomycetes bacterium]|nr:PDZ domain-containing protein [Planctomycetota bacterium]
GKYLYFLSNRFFEPIMDSQNFDYIFPSGAKPCLIPLRLDIPSPFASAQREARAPGDDSAKSDKKDDKGGKDAKKKEDDKKKDTPEPVKIDLDGVSDRVVAFPVPIARYGMVFGVEGKALFTSSPLEYESWMDEVTEDNSAKDVLHVHDFDTEKTEVLVNGISDVQTSLKAKHLLVTVGRRLRAVSASGLSKSSLSSSDSAGRESGWIDLDRVSVEINPRAEWRQMFREAWRLQRDHFWNTAMSDVNWQNVHDRYLPLVDRCASRAEFSDLMWEMQGELGTSHCYEMGGDYRPEPRYHQGFLGADIELRGNAWRIVNIVRGDSWDSIVSSPLADPAVNVKNGDEIVAVNGAKVNRSLSPFECLVNASGANIALRLRSGGKERDVVVRCLRSEAMLRYRNWVEGNRAAVHKASKGRIGYVHIPDMGPLGFAEFNRYFPREVECEGLIIDVRFNGGGHVSQLLLQRLLRKRIGYDINRWGKPMSYPADAPMGPMAALTNEHAGSDGDMFSHCFKLYKLGPLIGKRTWGGVVGIWPRHALVDGTVTTQPEFSFWFSDVGYGIENYGTDPDIEVDIAPQDFARGKDPQLECGIAEVEKLIRKMKPRVPEFKGRPSLKAPRLPKAKR